MSCIVLSRTQDAAHRGTERLSSAPERDEQPFKYTGADAAAQLRRQGRGARVYRTGQHTDPPTIPTRPITAKLTPLMARAALSRVNPAFWPNRTALRVNRNSTLLGATMSHTSPANTQWLLSSTNSDCTAGLLCATCHTFTNLPAPTLQWTCSPCTRA